MWMTIHLIKAREMDICVHSQGKRTKKTFCLHFTNAHAHTQKHSLPGFCFALVWFYINATFANTGVFYGCFIFHCLLHGNSYRVYSKRPLTKACWRKPLKCGKKPNPKGKNVFQCVLVWLWLKTKKRKQSKNKNRRKLALANALLVFQVVCGACLLAHIIVLSPMSLC